MKKIIVINSTLGCGKSTVSKALSKCFTKSKVIHGDDLSKLINNFSVYDSDKLHQCLELIAKKVIENSSTVIIVDFVFEIPGQLSFFFTRLPDEYTYSSFYLKASLEELEGRIRRRDLEDPDPTALNWEVKRTKEILEIQRNYIDTGRIGRPIETNNREVLEIVEEIKFYATER